jgi:DNA-binding LytR/AlgR family response regulator
LIPLKQTGAVVSVDGGLSAEQAIQLRDRILRLNESNDKLAELATNINDQAARYWDLNSTEPQTTVRVWVQDLIFASTHGDQVRAILQVSVMVIKKTDKPLGTGKDPLVKGYEYASPYASLDS